MSLNVENEYGEIQIPDYEHVIETVIGQALDFIKCPYECEIYVLLTDNSGIQTINNCQRNIDAPTDVLSFPLIDYKEPGDFSVVDGDTCDYFNPESGELMLGYDHIDEEERKQMEDLQEQILNEKGYTRDYEEN